jgi:hypothetical protein
MSSVEVEVDFAERRSRLTALVRVILWIPLAILGFVWVLLAELVALVAWFVIVVAGRYPEGWWAFCAGLVRFSVRAAGYLFLAVDPYPPFDGGEHPEYPVRVALAHQARYSRFTTLLRIIYIVPAYLVVALLGVGMYLVAPLSWLSIVIAGRLPALFARYDRSYLRWYAKYLGLAFLVIDSY